MSPQEIAALIHRLDKAEAEIAQLRNSMRRSRWTAMAGKAAAVAGLALVMIYAPPGRPQAQGVGQTVAAPFTITGANGAPILTVKGYGDQNNLILYGPGQKLATVLMANERGGFMTVAGGSSGKLKAALYVDDSGNGGLEIADSEGAKLAAVKKGEVAQGLVIYRPGGNKPAFEALANGELSEMTLRDAEDMPSGITVGGQTGLYLRDHGGQPLASLQEPDAPAAAEGDGAAGETPAKPDKGRGLRVFNPKGEVAAKVAADNKGGGYVSVKGEDGSQGLLGMRMDGTGSELILAGPSAQIGA